MRTILGLWKGQMKGAVIADPFVEQPYDIVFTTIKEEDPLAFTEELGQFPERDIDPPGPGVTAQITPVTTAMSQEPQVMSGSSGFGRGRTPRVLLWSCLRDIFVWTWFSMEA